MRHTIILLFTFVLFVSVGTTQAAPNLQISDGQLTGATGVNVQGLLYDVKFLDGSCYSIFDVCENFPLPSAFAFRYYEEVHAASLALLDQVFTNTGTLNIDSNPNLVRGCSSNLMCETRTFFDIDFAFDPNLGIGREVAIYKWATNHAILPDEVSPRNRATGIFKDVDTSLLPTANVAVWSLTKATPPSIPEPGTIWLLSSGLIGLAGYQWQRGRKTSHSNG